MKEKIKERKTLKDKMKGERIKKGVKKAVEYTFSFSLLLVSLSQYLYKKSIMMRKVEFLKTM